MVTIVITIAPINVSISFGESKRCDGTPLRAEKFRRLAGYDIPELVYEYFQGQGLPTV